MITILKLAKGRTITIHTSENSPRPAGGVKVEGPGFSQWFSLSPAEQARLCYALADHENRKRDEIKELK